jgi:predicted ATPase/class 3 adenylate cyclase
MPELPTGTVTFLFSDIEGSTRLLQLTGERWPALLERHRVLLREAFTAHDGVEVGTEGDSFFVAFPTAANAVRAAVAAQRALADEPWGIDEPLRVRMGLHTGLADVRDGTYVGIDVHRAARIGAVAYGGQVLLSDAVRALVTQDLDPRVTLRDLGEHHLKDLDAPERLYQLAIEGLPDRFPPLASGIAVLNNLPRRLTTFLGREREIAEVQAALEGARLLTLTGPGGTGKTRLSLEVAGRSLDRYPGGVFFVELSPVAEAELIATAIAQALGLPDAGGRSASDRIIDHLADRRVLLVLDNFEQVTEGAPVVAELLTRVPNLSVLATTRAPLHVSGEQEYPVPPLSLPDLAHLPGSEGLSQYEAVRLFIERARAVKPDFAVTNDNAPAVAEICVRLDGLPLAIELAAARIRILSPQAMLGRLEHRLSLLSSGLRDLPARQQTLRGAIAWSHDMLDETDRALFACLSVFAGSAGLAEIERVCGGEIGGDPLDALGSLVDKSLVRQVEGLGGEARFAMLETIREFAIEQATERGRLEELRDRHAALFSELAESAAHELMGASKAEWLNRLDEEHDNLRAAQQWFVESGRAEAALHTAFVLWRFWQMRGHLAEGVDRVRAALAMPHAADHPAALADAYSAIAGLTYWQGSSEESRSWYEREIALRRQLGDRAGLAEALYGISFTWSISGLASIRNANAARGYIEEAVNVFREIGDEMGAGRGEWALANVFYGTGDIAAARQHSLSALAIFEAAQDDFMVGWATYTLALAELGDDYQGRATPETRIEARRLLTRALEIFHAVRDITGYTLVLDGFALLAYLSGDLSLAARLSGAVHRLELDTGTGINLWNREILGFNPAVISEDPEHRAEWEEGMALDAEAAVALALEQPAPAAAS